MSSAQREGTTKARGRGREAYGPAPNADAARPTGSQGRGRAASTAQSISHGIIARRFFAFLFFDILLVAALFGAFVVSSGLRAGVLVAQGPILRAVPGATISIEGDVRQPATLAVRAEADGNLVGTYPVTDALPYAVPVLGITAVCELFSLLNGGALTRRIRRKLKPLNDLALAAEAVGNIAAQPGVSGQAGVGAAGMAAAADGMAGLRDADDKIDSLERAISSATVDSPQVSTGDEDLRSIEVALNGLLMRMQQAKLQQMRFVDDASHELRTPIAVIQGYVGMLDRWGKTDPEVLDESIAALKSETASMKELVDQLLFLARGDAGRTHLDRAPLDLGQIAREVCEESRMIDADHVYELVVPAAGSSAAAGRAGGLPGVGCATAGSFPAADGSAPTAETNTLSSPYALIGDAVLIKQCMRIMVQNAAKYSPAGTRITISVARNARTGEVSFSVQDEGIGMTADEARHVFERFWQADKARQASKQSGTGGSGLGLSIAKWIVDAHDGHIDVLSAANVGTRFTVRLPAGR